LKRWLAVLLVAWAPGVVAQWNELTFVDPSLGWRTLETRHFEVHFPDRQRTQARAVAGAAERILPGLTALLRWQPRSRIHVVVLDSADFANGLASPLPFNYTMLFLSPPDDGELLQNREWLDLVLTHELFHIVHLDKARGGPLNLRRVFGRLAFLFPNALQPSWITEGLAVHAESDPALGYGRLGNAQFEGMMRAEASRGLRRLSEMNAGGRGFPLNRDYLYGGYFFAFLQERYGAKAVVDFIENYSGNVIPFRVHSNPQAVTRKNMDQLWAEYETWLRARFGSGRERVQEGEPIAHGWLLSNPTLAADGTRWYIEGDGYTLPKLRRQSPGGRPESLHSVEPDARLSASANGNLVVSQPEICGNYNYYYDLYRIAADGAMQRLSRCARNRMAAALDDGGAVALRMDGGSATVVSAAGEVLYRATPGESITGIAATPSLTVVTSLRDGRWSLIAIREGRAEVLVSDPAIKHSPRIGERDEVFFIANYGNVYDVWSVGHRGGALSRWTRAAHGVREISAPYGGELLLTTIEADGDVLRSYRLPDAPLERATITMAAPASSAASPAPADAPDRRYSPWSSLMPRSWFPIIEIAEGAVSLGVITDGQDALGLHQYILAPQYEFTQNEVLGSAAYIYDWRHALLADRVMTVRETEDNEVRAYTIEEGVQWVSTWRHLALSRRFYWGVGGALERETFHRVGVGAIEDRDERVLGLVAGLDTRREQWLSEGPSQGLQIRLFAETSRGLHAAYEGDVYRADSRLHLPLGRTVLALRWNEATGESDAEPFQLGGSFSDPGSLLPLINQRDFPLRGYGSGEPSLAGHRVRLGSLEWRVPLKDIDRHLMVPPAGLNRLSLNLFYEVGDAWFRGTDPDWHRGYGIELLSEIRLGYLFGAQMRLGVAHGPDEGGRTSAYLRVGRAF
jgi:hypothetical protein